MPNKLNLLNIKKHQLTALIVLVFCFFVFAFSSRTSDTNRSVNDYIINQCDSILFNLDSISSLKNSNTTLCKEYYCTARKAYKHIEFFIEHQFPFHAKYFINGPLVSRSDFEYNFQTFTPHGFQVIEQYLYSDSINKNIHIDYEITLLKETILFVKHQSLNKINTTNSIVDMMRLEILRIMGLTLNGYDATIEKQNLLPELISNLQSITTVLKFISTNDKEIEKLKDLCVQVNRITINNKNIDSLDRLSLITDQLIPIYNQLYSFYNKEDLKNTKITAVNIWNPLFKTETLLNASFFKTELRDSNLIDSQANLGAQLFIDPILSGNNKRSCASCHNPDYNFSNKLKANLNFDKKTVLSRHTPSLINVSFQKSFFDDGRSMQLEDQVSDVIQNPKEMNGNPIEIIAKLKSSLSYKKLFKDAFKDTQDTAVTYYGILKSIAEYERTLVSLSSRFDKYINGDKQALDSDEIAGYNIFSGKAQCGSCHFFPLFNGTVPPNYNDNEFEVIGTPKSKSQNKIDTDSGRINISKNNIHLYSFKTPSLRNLNPKGPFMHNAAFSSLEEVIDFYNNGSGYGLGYDLRNQTSSKDSLHLTKLEKHQLKKFLMCLNSPLLKEQHTKHVLGQAKVNRLRKNSVY